MGCVCTSFLTSQMFEAFPQHTDLTERYANDTGIDVAKPEAKMLFMADSPAWSISRYYQDAAIRAAFEKIIRSNQSGEPARVLLALAISVKESRAQTLQRWVISILSPEFPSLSESKVHGTSQIHS